MGYACDIVVFDYEMKEYEIMGSAVIIGCALVSIGFKYFQVTH